MKNSLNYTGFSSNLVIARKRKKTPPKSSLAIEAEHISTEAPSRYCPPYLMQQGNIKGSFKK